MKTLVLATHNRGKVVEFHAMLGGLVETLACAADYDLPEPEETGATFTENAILKAEAACAATGLPCLADDSGLAVEALGGAPGIYSARWAGPDKDFGAAMQRVHDELGGQVTGRKAMFVAVLALAVPGRPAEIFEGLAHGTLVWPGRGERGFGYDPIFVPDGHTITFGEMAAEDKHAISHRAKAVEAFRRFLESDGSRLRA